MWKWVRPGGSLLVIDYDFSALNSSPVNRAVGELKELIYVVLRGAGLDPERGGKLNELFQQAGIGQPDGTDNFTTTQPIQSCKQLLRATYDSFSLQGIALGLWSSDRVQSYFTELDELSSSEQVEVTSPFVVSAWKKKGCGT